MSEPTKAVFLSYASQDAEAAKRICDALRHAGVEVWFDQSELVGGDQWDGKIRGQISSCALFMPIISANTQARLEGYFRLEWKLAAQRTHTMADEKTFLLPVVIDDTRDAEAKVPGEFKSVQWTKLPGGETPAAFCARVKMLLEGNAEDCDETSNDTGRATGPGSAAADVRKTKVRTENREPKTVNSKSSRWLVPVIAGGVIALLAVMLTRSGEKSPAPTPRASPAARPPPAAPLSAARQLVERATEIVLTRRNRSSADLDAAAELCAQARTLDPNDALVWAMAARIDAARYQLGYDTSDERKQRAQQAAARAITLAPTSKEARGAQAVVFLHVVGTPEMLAEAEKIFRDLLREEPDSKDMLSGLSGVLEQQGRIDEAVAIMERLGNPLAAGWTYFNHGRFAEAGMMADRVLARDRNYGGLYLRVHVELLGFEDPEAAQRTFNEFPQAELLGENGASVALLIGNYRRDPDLILRVMAAFPNDFLTKIGFVGPKRAWIGRAHEMAGRPEAARAEWTVALQQVMDRRKTGANDLNLLQAEAMLRAFLGQTEEADRVYRLYRNLITSGAQKSSRIYDLWTLMRLDRKEDALAVLEDELRNHRPGWQYLHSNVRFGPELDALRGDPRFERLLRETKPPDAKPFDADKTMGNRLTPTTAPVDSKSVAVLAFANLSDDKGNEYFSDGISEELLNVLAKIPGLKVTARTSSFHFKGKDTPIPEIAAQLGVAYVIEGSVRKQGDKVRITAQLIKAADGFHVWSDTFTRDLKDIFAVQDEIAGLIAQQLQLKLGESSRVTKVVNPEAYRLLLEGRQFWNLRSEEGFTKAEAAFTKALAIDPQFAEAHAGLGGVCVIRAVYHELDDVPLEANDLARAVSEGRRALEIDPASADALAVLAYAQMMGNQLAESDRHFQQALEHNSNSALVHCWYALLLNAQGRLDASIRHYQKAAEVDPLWFINLHMMGSALSFAQRYDQALGILERADALRTEVFMPDLWERARALLALGRKEEAFAVARQVLRNPDQHPRWGSDAMAIHVLWSGGRRQEAEEEAGRLFTRYPQESYLRGFIFAAMGRFNEALPFLQHTPSVMVRHIYWDTMWDPWREDPRFLQLMAGFGRTEEYKVARATLARMQEERKK